MGSPEKHKKIGKEKKDKKHKHKHKRDRQSPQHEQMAGSKYQQQYPNMQSNSIVEIPKNINEQQSMPAERTHVNCRRCKQPTFSLKTRTCHKCGYPKCQCVEQRPKYFPAVKQVQVLDLIRQGKLVHNSYAPVLMEVIANDRFGKKQRVKCCPTDSIFDLKKLISAQTGTRPQKIRLQKGNVIYKDHLALDDYEIKDGTGLEMYYD